MNLACSINTYWITSSINQSGNLGPLWKKFLLTIVFLKATISLTKMTWLNVEKMTHIIQNMNTQYFPSWIYQKSFRALFNVVSTMSILIRHSHSEVVAGIANQ